MQRARRAGFRGVGDDGDARIASSSLRDTCLAGPPAMDTNMGTDKPNNLALAEKALATLYASAGRKPPYVTCAFLGFCLLVTIPTLFYPGLYGELGGIEPRRHWWQLFTAVFEHGWPGFHGSIHLALNVFLILECGRPCERLLGSGRFLALGLLSMAANALAQTFTEGVNGSSLVIWSWGPPLFVAMAWAKRQSAEVRRTKHYERLRAVLVLMYGVIVLVMALLPYLSGWRGNPLLGALLGNLYHLVATGVGILFAWFSSGYIRKRMSGFA